MSSYNKHDLVVINDLVKQEFLLSQCLLRLRSERFILADWIRTSEMIPWDRTSYLAHHVTLPYLSI